MSTWSQPYLTVTDAAGHRVDWRLPDPLPWPAGACADASLRTPAALGLPTGGTIKVRWRTPCHANPRSRSTATTDLQTVALAFDVLRAARTGGDGWQPDANGWPVHVRPTPTTAPPAPAPVTDDLADLAPLTGACSAVSPDNAVLADIRSGRRQLGATVAQVITAIRRQREPGWSGAHKVNMNNMLGFLEQVLVYTEPFEDDTDADLPEVVAWMRARLALPGVELGQSMHVALLLSPDLERAIAHRRNVDRRVELLNEQAVTRFLAEWERYEALMAARARKPRGGRAPKRPAEAPLLREPELPVKARTEELFATGLAMVLGYAEHNGLLVGPNPWPTFISRGPNSGYRRSENVRPHLRNVPPVGAVLALADAIARRGPLDPRTGKPTGERFRALVLTLLLGLRPSELDALAKADFRPGAAPTLHVTKAASAVHTLATKDGASQSIREGLKARDLGAVRVVHMPQAIASALSEHIAAGYATDEHLFTSPEGDMLRWGNLIETYWRPAVEEVFGRSSSPLLRQMPRRWLRKAAITWLLRAGLDVAQVAEITGHDVMTLYTHYAGVVVNHPQRHTWHDWDTAWEWAVKENDVP